MAFQGAGHVKRYSGAGKLSRMHGGREFRLPGRNGKLHLRGGKALNQIIEIRNAHLVDIEMVVPVEQRLLIFIEEDLSLRLSNRSSKLREQRQIGAGGHERSITAEVA